jgi:hypothetical protein
LHVLHWITNFFEKNPLGFPILLLGLSLVTYGVFIFSLGFYWDDWPTLLLSHIGNKATIWEYYSFDRPFQSWTYYLLFPICRDSAFAWQLSGILFRWTAALSLYFAFIKVFPKQRALLQWAAILFTVFPGFSNQYVSIPYSSVFLSLTIFGFSLLAMVSAIQTKKRFWFYLIISLALSMLSLLTVEYFAGLEVLRPILTFILVYRLNNGKGQKFLKSVGIWLPFILVDLGFVYWRFILYPASLDGISLRNAPALLTAIQKNGSDALFTLLQSVLGDMRYLFVSSWIDRLWQVKLPLQRITFWLSLAIGLAAGLLIYFLYRKNEENKSLKLSAAECWSNLGIGFASVVFGMIPAWMTMREITVGKWSDRLALPAMLGVALIFAAIFFRVISNYKIRGAFLALLTGLAISYHLQIGNDYRKDFLDQEAIYTQLKWRIPDLQPGTTLYSPGIPTNKEAEYSYTMGINMLFGEKNLDTSLDYWFATPRFYKPEALAADPEQNLAYNMRSYHFTGSAEKIVSIYVPPSGCIWVVDHYFSLMPYEVEFLPLYGDLTNQDMIIDRESDENGLAKIFDFDAQNSWCYYFQKGDLAQSKGQFEKAVSIYEQAMDKGLVPMEGIEYLPFIEAYTSLGRIEDAAALTAKTLNKSYFTKPVMCQYWHDRLADDPSISAVIDPVYNADNCPSFFKGD